ncbi:MAG: thioredoxin [Alistipes sp.]
MALAINNDNFESLKNDSKPLVVDFWAEWCGPCRMVAPIVEELAAEYEGRVNIGKCDVDNNDDLVAMFRVRNIPTLLFLKGGEIVDKHVGAISKNDLKAKIEALL